MDEIKELVSKLEAKVLRLGRGFSCLPGTSISRGLSPKKGGGYLWIVGAGHLSYPLQWFHDPVLETALKKAIKDYKGPYGEERTAPRRKR
mgnify:CR=1 FL=1